MKKNILLIFILIIFSIPAILPLFNKGFFQSDDGEWMVIRFSAFHQALRDGQFPVRFLSRLNYGYGYPVANFLYPGFMYFGELFRLLGFGFVETIKIIFGVSMVGSILFTYLWLSKLFGRWSAFVGSLLYLYAPYHLLDSYKRGSIGEVLALSLVPFILWQIEKRSFFWTSLGIAFLILSHNTLALLFLPVIVLYLISRGLPSTIYFLPSILLGLGLSSFFWIPALFDLQHTVFYKTQVGDWQNHFVPLGLVGATTFFIFVWSLIHFDYSNNRTKLFMFLIGVVSLFLSLPASSIIWKILPVSIVQFPFRFLSIAMLSVAFLSAFLIYEIKGIKSLILGIVIIAISFLSSFSYLSPSVFFDKGDSYYATNEDTTTVKGEYMPLWAKSVPKEHFNKRVEISHGEVKNLLEKSNNISFSTSSRKNTLVTIHMIYFPGWKATVDNKAIAINYQNSGGLIQIPVEEGTHEVKVTFLETPVRLVSNFVSLLSGLGLIVFLFL